jgi:phosphoglycerate dehydrogenase-like enzyme
MRCVILDDFQQVAMKMADWDRLRPEVLVEAETRHLSDPDRLVERLAGVAIVVANRERTPFPAHVLERLPDLRLLVTTGAANAAIDAAACARLGITFCGTRSDGYGAAELTWALVLALARNLVAEVSALREGRWQQGLGRGLDGARLGLVGLGRVGSRVAAFGKAFGMQVSAWTPGLTAARAAELGVTAASSLEELCAGSDVLSLHAPLGPQTRGLVDERRLSLLPAGALVVNTSRFGLIDARALEALLRSGHLGGAALDVFDVEPLPQDHPLRSVPNLLLTPHIGFVIEQTYRRYFADALENIETWLAGSPVRVIAAP